MNTSWVHAILLSSSLACAQAAEPPAVTPPAAAVRAPAPVPEQPCGFDNDVRLQLMAANRLLLVAQPRLHVTKSLEPQQAKALEAALIALAPEFCRDRKVVPAQANGVGTVSGAVPVLSVKSYDLDDPRTSPSATLALEDQPCRPGPCDSSVRLLVQRNGVTWLYAARRDAYEFIRRPLSELASRAPAFAEPPVDVALVDVAARGPRAVAQLQQQLGRHVPEIRACETFLPLRRAGSWQVRAKFSVDPGGAAHMQESTCAECPAALTRCVASATSRWTFPAIAGAADGEVSYSARFQSKGLR